MSTRAPRNTLTRERVLRGAVELADRDGLGALTIRALATHLEVRPMALYHHVANKDVILDAIVDAVSSEVHAPDPAKPWRAELARYARSMRGALGRHPWAISIMESRAHPGPENLARHEAVLGALRTAGFALPATAHAYAALDAFVLGFALQEAMLANVGLRDDPADLAAGIDLARSPHMAEFVRDHALRPDYAFADSFEPGLAMVLDGIERLDGAPPA